MAENVLPFAEKWGAGGRQPLRGLRTSHPDRRLCRRRFCLRGLCSVDPGNPSPADAGPGPGRRARGLGCRAPSPHGRFQRVSGHWGSGRLSCPPPGMERPLHGWAGMRSRGQREARLGKGMALPRETPVLRTGRSPTPRPLRGGRPHFTGMDSKVSAAAAMLRSMCRPAWSLAPRAGRGLGLSNGEGRCGSGGPRRACWCPGSRRSV